MLAKELLTPAEASQLTGFSIVKLREMATDGDLPAIKDGDKWLFPRTQLILSLSERAIKEQYHRKFNHVEKVPHGGPGRPKVRHKLTVTVPTA